MKLNCDHSRLPGVRSLFGSDHGSCTPAAPTYRAVSGRMRGLLLAGVICIGAVFPAPMNSVAVATSSGNSVSTDYVLGPRDKIKLRVFEWRASRDEIYNWEPINSEYIVSASGKLSLPLIGEVAAAGQTSAAVAALVGDMLRKRLGFSQTPDVAMEIVEYRPFYITGHIATPGEYPYRPGLTVLQAMAIAGGQFRSGDQGVLRLEREMIAAHGELQVYENETHLLLARVARITAELEGSHTIEFPKILQDRILDPRVSIVVTQEKVLYVARQQAFDHQIAVLEKQQMFLNDEIKSLKDQIEVQNKQIDSMQNEHQSIRELVEKGLAVKSRSSLLERAEAQLVGDRMRLESNLLKARLELSRTDSQIAELYSKRSTEAAAELQTVKQRLEEIARRTITAQSLLFESEVIAPLNVSSRTGRAESQPTFKITRIINGQGIEIDATENSLIQPGDTVKVAPPVSTLEKSQTLQVLLEKYKAPVQPYIQPMEPRRKQQVKADVPGGLTLGDATLVGRP